MEAIREKGISMRALLLGMIAIIGLVGGWLYLSMSADHKQQLADHPCIKDYKLCRSLKELIDFYPPVSDGRISCIIAAEDNLKYGPPVWPSALNGPKFGAHLKDEKSWRTGTITLVEEHALIPNAFGGKEKRTMFCKYDLNTKEVISLNLD